MAMLNWFSNYDPAKVLHKGTELATALCGAHSRFQICDVRAFDAESETYTGHVYCARDAATVTLAQTAEGVRPAIVARFDDLDEAIAYCQTHDPADDWETD